MPLQNRIAKCDICMNQAEEKTFNEGWAGWAHIRGIGATAPADDASIVTENIEMWLCPECTGELTQRLTEMQEEH